MKRVVAGIDINADLDRVWDLLTRFEYWPAWGTTVRSVTSPSTRVEPGATGRVRTILGFWLPFAMTGVVEHASWHWRVAGIPATGHDVRRTGTGITRVEFTVPWPAAPYLVAMHASLRRLKRLAERAEHGASE
jgi:hypothetical protein